MFGPTVFVTEHTRYKLCQSPPLRSTFLLAHQPGSSSIRCARGCSPSFRWRCISRSRGRCSVDCRPGHTRMCHCRCHCHSMPGVAYSKPGAWSKWSRTGVYLTSILRDPGWTCETSVATCTAIAREVCLCSIASLTTDRNKIGTGGEARGRPRVNQPTSYGAADGQRVGGSA